MPPKHGVYQIRVYGKHKLRTVKTSAWESPEDVFKSPLAKKDRVLKPVTTFYKSNAWSKATYVRRKPQVELSWTDTVDRKSPALGSKNNKNKSNVLVNQQNESLRTPEERTSKNIKNGSTIVISSSEDSSPENGTKAVVSYTHSTSDGSLIASPTLFSSSNSSIERQREEYAAVDDLSPLPFDESFPGSLSHLKYGCTNLKYVHSTPNSKVFTGHLSVNLSCENYSISRRSSPGSCANQKIHIVLKNNSLLLEQLQTNGLNVNKESSKDSLPRSMSLSSVISNTIKDRNCVNAEDRRHERASCPASISCQHDISKHSSCHTSGLVKECIVSLEKLRLTPLLSKSRKRRSDIGAHAFSQSEKSETALTPELSCHLPASLLSFKEVLTPIKMKNPKESKEPIFLSAFEKVLLECEQEDVLKMKDVFKPSILKKCQKIGEGVYGEVYSSFNRDRNQVAIKIIPVGGKFSVNGVPQKTFEEILPEIVISRELSDLGHSEAKEKENEMTLNLAPNFIRVHDVSCCQGKYPVKLIKEWDDWDQEHDSENDRPDIFPEEQHFIVFEFANGGRDLEHFEFHSSEEAISVLQQTAFSLAVAEQAMEFEHRDLHWGNVLISPTNEESIGYSINGKKFFVQSHGVLASIIDFTLSRMTKDGVTVFCDLTNDEDQFTGKGDYQFDIYRLMRKANDNEWDLFNPFTNVLWLHYMADKMLKKKKYPTKNRNSDISLRKFLRNAQKFDSCVEMVSNGLMLE